MGQVASQQYETNARRSPQSAIHALLDRVLDALIAWSLPVIVMASVFLCCCIYFGVAPHSLGRLHAAHPRELWGFATTPFWIWLPCLLLTQEPEKVIPVAYQIWFALLAGFFLFLTFAY